MRARGGRAVRIISNLQAFAAGIVSTLITVVLLAHVGAQSLVSNSVDVCADASGTLRLVEAAMPCEPGQRRLHLRQPNVQPQNQKNPADSQLDDLTHRLQALEESSRNGKLLGTSQVKAPFEVLNSAGVRIFRVEEGKTSFYDPSGGSMVRIIATASGGRLETASGTESLRAELDATADNLKLSILESGAPRIELGRSAEKRYSLRVVSQDGKSILAGVAQSQAGSGLITVNDTTGQTRARLSVDSMTKGGVMAISNSDSVDVATLLASENGNGRLTLSNRVGKEMVEAGVLAGDIGVVRTGPSSFGPGGSFVTGFPASYIIGKAAK